MVKTETQKIFYRRRKDQQKEPAQRVTFLGIELAQDSIFSSIQPETETERERGKRLISQTSSRHGPTDSFSIGASGYTSLFAFACRGPSGSESILVKGSYHYEELLFKLPVLLRVLVWSPSFHSNQIRSIYTKSCMAF